MLRMKVSWSDCATAERKLKASILHDAWTLTEWNWNSNFEFWFYFSLFLRLLLGVSFVVVYLCTYNIWNEMNESSRSVMIFVPDFQRNCCGVNSFSLVYVLLDQLRSFSYASTSESDYVFYFYCIFNGGRSPLLMLLRNSFT